MTRYYDEFENEVLPPMNMNKILAEVLCNAGKTQLRISETQKFRHVTSFFNSKLEEPFCLEDRVLVKSNKISEDKQPEMRAPEVTDLVVTAIKDGIGAIRQKAEAADGVVLTADENVEGDRLKETYDVIVLNFANCDMVGHRGFFDAAVKAVEAVDKGVGKVIDAVLAADGIALVTADHGNVEQMIDPQTGKPHTAHTTLDVELFYIANDTAGVKLVDRGILSDVAPTILKLLGVEKPEEMTRGTLFL
jgi:2,3-bisphosphoglycerate-independent phosphoglycerate mutase